MALCRLDGLKGRDLVVENLTQPNKLSTNFWALKIFITVILVFFLPLLSVCIVLFAHLHALLYSVRASFPISMQGLREIVLVFVNNRVDRLQQRLGKTLKLPAGDERVLWLSWTRKCVLWFFRLAPQLTLMQLKLHRTKVKRDRRIRQRDGCTLHGRQLFEEGTDCNKGLEHFSVLVVSRRVMVQGHGVKRRAGCGRVHKLLQPAEDAHEGRTVVSGQDLQHARVIEYDVEQRCPMVR